MTNIINNLQSYRHTSINSMWHNYCQSGWWWHCHHRRLTNYINYL